VVQRGYVYCSRAETAFTLATSLEEAHMTKIQIELPEASATAVRETGHPASFTSNSDA